jgi:20S proteasome alpha/beta subunit
MGDVVLLTTPVSAETVAALTHLLAEARAGHVIGVAYVAMHKASDFTIDYAGSIRQYPLVAIGATSVLAQELIELTKRK